MKNLGYTFFGLIISLLVVSCGGEDGDTASLLPSSGGAGHEIVVVSDHVPFDSSRIGQVIKNYFEDEFKGLSTSEKNFDIINVKTNDFNSLLQRHNKILLINDQDASFPTAKADIKTEIWAKNQLVVKLNARSEKAAVELFDSKKEELLSMYHEWDMRNLGLNFWRQTSKSYQEHLQKNFGIRLAIPEKYHTARSEKDFIWFRYDTDKSIQGILVYKEPYTADSTFTRDYIVNRRNEMSQKYVPGPSEGSYMAVDSVFPVRQVAITLDDCYAMESKGIWVMENDFMGGSFVSYTVYNEKKQEIITVDGFVHAPNQKKKYMMLEVEAIVKSILVD